MKYIIFLIVLYASCSTANVQERMDITQSDFSDLHNVATIWENIDLETKKTILEKSYTFDERDISAFTFLLNEYLTSDSLNINYEYFLVINSGFISESNYSKLLYQLQEIREFSFDSYHSFDESLSSKEANKFIRFELITFLNNKLEHKVPITIISNRLRSDSLAPFTNELNISHENIKGINKENLIALYLSYSNQVEQGLIKDYKADALEIRKAIAIPWSIETKPLFEE